MKKLAMKVYSGRRDKAGNCVVHVIDGEGESRLLDPRLDLENKSPTGFEWGYGGSGPAQLALAILADCVGPANVAVALRNYQNFKWRHITTLKRDAPWTIKEQVVVDFVVEEEIRRGKKPEEETF